MEQTLSMDEELTDSLAYPWYIVSLCMLAYIFSFIDRQVITLLIEPIRADLQISDTQFSLLHGLAFAILYAIAGIPIARMADSRSRPVIISVGIFVWSLAFIIGGTAISLVEQWGSQTFPIIGVVKPWQMTFFMVGLPGILVALLFFFTVRDPQRKGVAAGANQGYSFKDVLAYIGGHRRTFASHYIGFGLLSLSLFALMNWAPAYFLRKYALSMREVGLYLGMVVLIGNSLGVLASGWLTDYFSRRGYLDAPMRAGMIGGLGVVIPATLVALCTDYLFKNEAMVGYSMSLISVLGAVIGAWMLRRGCSAFAETYRQVTSG